MGSVILAPAGWAALRRCNRPRPPEALMGGGGVFVAPVVHVTARALSVEFGAAGGAAPALKLQFLGAICQQHRHQISSSGACRRAMVADSGRDGIAAGAVEPKWGKTSLTQDGRPRTDRAQKCCLKRRGTMQGNAIRASGAGCMSPARDWTAAWTSAA